MKYVCGDCGAIIEHMGHPVSALVDSCSKAFFDRKIVAYHPILSPSAQAINPALRYLEDWGILVSTEVSMQMIGIAPNLSIAYVDEFRAEICWCTLFDLNEGIDDDFDPDYVNF